MPMFEPVWMVWLIRMLDRFDGYVVGSNAANLQPDSSKVKPFPENTSEDAYEDEDDDDITTSNVSHALSQCGSLELLHIEFLLFSFFDSTKLIIKFLEDFEEDFGCMQKIPPDQSVQLKKTLKIDLHTQYNYF